MTGKMLVTYATWAGSTAEVAETVGEILGEDGTAVEVRPARDVPDLSPYSAVLLGSAIRMGRPNSQAQAFVGKHQGALSRMPVAYFIVCLTMQEDTEENRCTAEEFVQALRDKAPEVQPVGLGLFGGVLDYDKLGLPLKLVLKLAKVQEGDYRNWDAIREWAEELRPALRTTDG